MIKAAKFLAIFLIGVSSFVYGQDDCLLEMKPTQSLVIDQTGLLSKSEKVALENKLITFDHKSSVQILVAIVDNLCGYDQAAFTYELGEKWGVGDEKFDNGVVIMVKPTGGQGERKTFIAVGYGLEGVIPDAIAKRIIENEMIPSFKQGQFYLGIDKSTDILMGLALEEFSAKEYDQTTKKKVPIWPFLFMVLFFIIMLVTRVKSVRRHAIGNDLPFWTAFWLLSNNRHRSGGGWSDFNSGGGNFGGFGGFGGGSFGGGGAGGSW